MTERITSDFDAGKPWSLIERDKPYSQVYRRLAEYESAEEEGRLVVLPCKVGQCVYTNFSMSGWYMRKGKRPYIGRIVFIGLNVDDPYFNIILGEGKMLQFKFSEIGKRVFLTREEAEKALKGMEGSNVK